MTSGKYERPAYLHGHRQRPVSVWLNEDMHELIMTAAKIAHRFNLIERPTKHAMIRYSTEKVVTEFVRRYSEELDRQGDSKRRDTQDSIRETSSEDTEHNEEPGREEDDESSEESQSSYETSYEREDTRER